MNLEILKQLPKQEAPETLFAKIQLQIENNKTTKMSRNMGAGIIAILAIVIVLNSAVVTRYNFASKAKKNNTFNDIVEPINLYGNE
jgi:uncharacterized protein YjgD (DUF1641 family)